MRVGYEAGEDIIPKSIKHISRGAFIYLAALGILMGFNLPVQAGEVYRIGPSDVLEVTVWREDELNRSELLVRPDGRISLPLVDDVQAAGLTPMELKQHITKSLMRYLEAPQVFVEVKRPESHYFCVLGNVMKPGRYPMLTPTNVLQSLAMAEGFNEWAKKDDVVVLRGEGKRQRRLPFEFYEVIKGNNMSQNIIIQPGDVVVVP